MTNQRPTAQARTPELENSLRLNVWVRRLFGPFWVVPALWCVAAVAVGLTLPELDQHSEGFLPLLFQGGPDGARAVLSTIAGAMISVTGLVFSITIVVLQLASSQFSPRVLRTFLDSRITQHTLGVFAASFLYSLTVLRSVIDGSSSEDVKVPQLAVTLAFLLVLAAVGMFLAFIHHITQSISVSTIISRVADETRLLLEHSKRHDALPTEEPTIAHLPHQRVVSSRRTGHLDSVDLAALLRLATVREVRIEILHTLGSFVAEGAPIAVVASDSVLSDDDHWAGDIDRCLSLVWERTTQQDATYGLRRLVDIAERALSPGVNDPTTAVQVVDQLHDILRRLAAESDPSPVHLDDNGVPRLITRQWTFEQYLALAVDEIAHYGASGIQIPSRLHEMFLDLEVVATQSNRAAVSAKAAEVRRLCADQ